jgi:hypothetical protein
LWFTNYEGKRIDYVQTFIDDEYLSFPVCVHDDMMDCRARILDPVLDAKFPKIKETKEPKYEYSPNDGGWMG